MRTIANPSRPRRPVVSLGVLTLLMALLPVQSAFGASSDALQKELDRLAGEYGKVETQLAQTEAKQAALTKEQQEAQATIDARSAALRARAGHMYKSGGATTMIGQLLTSSDFDEFVKRIHYMGVLGGDDTELVEELTVAQTRSNQLAAELEATEARQSELAKNLSTQRTSVQGRLAEAQRAEEQKRKAAEEALRSQRLSAQRRAQLEAAAKGAPRIAAVTAPSAAAAPAGQVTSAGRFARFTLPLNPSGFANTWGAPRSGGRRHQGTDVMAPCGAPVYAVTDGTIQRTSSGGLGGISLYLRATNGDVFYYTHLRGFSNGSAPGKRVGAGDVIAVNGNTGNARGGPCHVHFEWKPNGGRSVNPYPLLNAAR
ncbi:MAG: peptidoglycan DD-metalloendopeptidase family protein [Actinomycetota bacterium]